MIRVVKSSRTTRRPACRPTSSADRCHRTLDRAVQRRRSTTLVEASGPCSTASGSAADVDVDRPTARPRAAGGALEPVPARPGDVAGRGARHPAKGLTGGAYDGHYFWDTETYVLPFLAYTQPRIARNLLRFRHSMLRQGPAAGRGARPARARSSRGGRSTARRRRRYYPAGTAQYHLNADIAFAIRRATSTSSGDDRLPRRGRVPRSSSRRRGCGRTSASTRDGDEVLPHPRRHRSRRVHDGRQRQRLTRT